MCLCGSEKEENTCEDKDRFIWEPEPINQEVTHHPYIINTTLDAVLLAMVAYSNQDCPFSSMH